MKDVDTKAYLILINKSNQNGGDISPPPPAPQTGLCDYPSTYVLYPYVEEFNMKMIVEEGMHDAEGILHFLSRILRPPTW